MKKFKTLVKTIAGAVLTVACVQSYAGTTSDSPNYKNSDGAGIIMLADNSSTMRDEDAKPAMGGEGDAALGGNAPNPNPNRSTSTIMDDATITAAVNTKLLADTTVSGLKIDVDTRSAVVYLTADNMKSQSSIDRAMDIAEETEGVKNVVSRMAIGDIRN